MIHNNEKLRQKAHELALTDDSYVSRRPLKQFLRDFNNEAEKMNQFIYSFHDCSHLCSQPAEEWLLDHAGFILEQLVDVREQLAKLWLSKLPRQRKNNLPRLLPICYEYFTQTEGELSEESLVSYLQHIQEIMVLTNAECWALPVFLRTVLLQKLSEIVGHIRERREVCLFVERLLSNLKPLRSNPAALSEALDSAGPEMPLSGPLIVHLVSHLREWTDDTSAVREWLMCKLENGTDSLDQIQTYEYQLQAAYQVQTGNLISSLRQIERWNWQELYGRISLIEQVLRQDGQGIYQQLEDVSRDLLRNRVERLARRFHVPESRVAEIAIELAALEQTQTTEGDEAEVKPRQSFAAYYLLEADGMKKLQLALKKCGSMQRGPIMIEERNPGQYFLTLSISCLLALIVFTLWVMDGATFTLWNLAIVLIVLLLPAGEWGVAAAHWLIEFRKKPIPLLRYDYSQGIPVEAATIVIVPVIWSTPEEVHELADRLELHYLANRDSNIYFALLGDFTDASEETMPGDALITEAAQKRITELNTRYADSGNSRFYFLQRRRLWNSSEKVWMGWERKRGKLVEFVELLRGSKETSYIEVLGNPSIFPAIRYVITLDADTQLPAGCARRMIATMNLPYNRPRLNTARTRVVEGYGVLQPRIATSYESAMRSRFTSLWSGAPGIDPYAFAVSDPYQDGIGEGIFTGKGIFDVDVFAQVLCERIPNNRVLSHDLLEGGFLRAGLISDVELVDEQPATFFAFQKRLHRWVRGDWQLLSWLFPQVGNRRGELAPADLSAITRWQIVDNLRRTLMPPVLFAIWCLGLTLLPGASGRWMILVAATLLLPVIRHCLTLGYLWKEPRSLPIVVLQAVVMIMALPFQTVLLLDAIVRTLFRLLISKRHLLEWVSSAEVERGKSKGRRPLLLGMKGGYVLVVLSALAAWVQPVPLIRWSGLTLSVVWALVPFLVLWLNKPLKSVQEELDETERDELRHLAEQIWMFFEDSVTEQEHWLPPDNVQIDPPQGTARRTSPTNIGLYLASVLAARDFGFIDTQGLVTRLERTIQTVERLEKWNGHLFNWIDTETLNTLPPKYVSTVDSGNLLCCFIAVKEGLAEWLERDAKASESEWSRQGRNIIARIEALIEKTQLAPLFNYGAGLFSLGYDAASNRQDPILYDLAASEARQASFIAIALGQIPVSHWQRLGRTMTRAGRRTALLSWSGTMFEYLMPALFMRTYRKTIWSDTYHAVVERQREYAQQRGVPYGISESGYFAFDHQLNYQYRAFGVPGLGFQRGLEQDVVIAPYASILALPFAAKISMENLRQLEKVGARGKYGFYEAVDYTESRLPNKDSCKVIRSFMAHHQGMSMLAIANVLLDHNMPERFHRNKQVQAVELLLQERIPSRPKVIRHPAIDWSIPEKKCSMSSEVVVHERQYKDGPGIEPEIGIYSNGSMSSVVTDSGGGSIRLGETAITRWREDYVQDAWGSFFYIRDVTADQVWSPGFLPSRSSSSAQRVHFGLDRVTFIREDDAIRTTMEICVSPEWNADLRRLTLANTSSETRVIEVTSYSEIVLTSPNVDEAHPAFSKLFVETAYDEGARCLLARRRPRHDEEKPLWAAHSLFPGGETLGPAEVETDRNEFVGRGSALSHPQKLRTRLRGTVGAVADPVFVMRQRMSIEPGEQIQLFAVTCIGETKDEAVNIAARFSSNSFVERTFQFSWTRSQIELRHLRMTSKEAFDFQKMACRLLYRSSLGKWQEKHIAGNSKGQSALWQYGISGDRPLLLVYIANMAHLPFIVKLLTGYEYLRRMGIRFDLVLMNESDGGYQQELQDALQRAAEDHVQKRDGLGGIFVLNSKVIPEADRTLLVSFARLILRADGRSLKSQLTWPQSRMELPKPFVPESTPALHASYSTGNGNELMFYNSWGGFTPDGQQYRLLYKNAHPLPAPWINVMANPQFGFLVSEQGTGYTWWRNSREFKLTPWSNDPVIDTPGEMGYFRDEVSGEVWTLFPWGAPAEQAYSVTHTQGFSRFRHERYGVWHEATMFVSPDDPVKIIEIRVKNEGTIPRRLSFTYYAEWVLGVRREADAAFVITEWDENTQTLQAHNTYQEHFRGAAAFLGLHLASDESADDEADNDRYSWTGSRREFFGRSGEYQHPAALKQVTLSGQTGPCSDPCGAVQLRISLEAGAEQTIYVMLGCDRSREAAAELAEKYRNAPVCRGAFERDVHNWENILQQIIVSTPSKEMDLLLNGWLLYQTLACRIWARTGFYQAGGAYGYRDQLQDSLALLHTRPDVTRSQILLHAAHQYEEGDVQHWWHEETGRGIRTGFSDDYLWLPYAIARYIEHTGDDSILDEQISYLHSQPLGDDEHERYEPTVVSSEISSVYEHGVRAIERALQRRGEHGLPLIGIGDWNDGMSRLGAEGRGESVWLAWFLCDVLERFALYCHKRGDLQRAERYKESREQLASAANNHGWDGQWYRRACTDSGQWIGSLHSKECHIDAIAQSWSILSGAAPEARGRQAMQSFDRLLVDRKWMLARLLDPPFDKTSPSPGYIQGYPPGIRENGGQYTHGVIWSIIAWCILGQSDKAVELFRILNPVTHTKTPNDVQRYKGEPYAMAADVYTAAPHEGRAGWTWYTGAAGWLYQAGIEWILGLRRKEERLYISPCIPDDWPGFTARYRYGKAWYSIAVINGRFKNEGRETSQSERSGKPEHVQISDDVRQDAEGNSYIDLIDDGEQHEIKITIQ